MIAEVYVDVYPHHLESGAEPPDIWWGAPDVKLGKNGRRFCAEVEVDDVAKLEACNMSNERIYANALDEENIDE